MKNLVSLCIYILIFLTGDLTLAQKTYYVSPKGSDSNSGTSESSPWKSITKINSFSFLPGDIIKFQRGGSFRDAELSINKSGTSSKRIVFTAYGSGSLPEIGDSISTAVSRTIKVYGNYITLENLKIYGSGNTTRTDAIDIFGDYSIVRNCLITGGSASQKRYGYGIIVASSASYTLIENNEISYVGQGIEVNMSKPATITKNYVHDIYATNSVDADGIRVVGAMGSSIFDANYEVVVSYNKVTRWGENALDYAYSSRVVTEYNEIYAPLTNLGKYSVGNAVKCGEAIDASRISTGSIFRYNTIHDLWAPQETDSPYDWGNVVFSGCKSIGLEIYYNLVYNTYGAAVVLTGKDAPANPAPHKIFNNTFITGSSAIQVWGSTRVPVYIRNNILKSGVQVSGKSYKYSYPRNSNEENQKWHGTDPYSFPTTYDIRVQTETESGRAYVGKNILVKDKSVMKVYSSTKVSEDYNNLYSTDPLLNSNFTLKTGSPAIDFGIDVGLTRDLSGKPIIGKPDVSAFEFGGVNNPAVSLKLRILLEGPFNGSNMSAAPDGFLPLNQPYYTAPWNYQGTEKISSAPGDIVDWVLLELRSGTSSSTAAGKRAALLKTDGSVVDIDGVSPVSFEGVTAGSYYVVVTHRNHLTIMSAGKAEAGNNPALYDFTSASAKAYGSNSLVELGGNMWGLYAGDGDFNGVINVVDYSRVANHLFEEGYTEGDTDLNGVVNILDYCKTNLNLFQSTRVPN